MSFFPFSPPLLLVFKYAPPCSTFWAVKKLFFSFPRECVFSSRVRARAETLGKRSSTSPRPPLILFAFMLENISGETIWNAGNGRKKNKMKSITICEICVRWIVLIGSILFGRPCPILLKFVFVFLLRDFASGFFFSPSLVKLTIQITKSNDVGEFKFKKITHTTHNPGAFSPGECFCFVLFFFRLSHRTFVVVVAFECLKFFFSVEGRKNAFWLTAKKSHFDQMAFLALHQTHWTAIFVSFVVFIL